LFVQPVILLLRHGFPMDLFAVYAFLLQQFSRQLNLQFLHPLRARKKKNTFPMIMYHYLHGVIAPAAVTGHESRRPRGATRHIVSLHEMFPPHLKESLSVIFVRLPTAWQLHSGPLVLRHLHREKPTHHEE
jgi:hypothetical protein